MEANLLRRTEASMKQRAFVAGATNLDRICRLELPMAGGASIPGRVSEFPGGAGLNVASNLAAFGVPVTIATVLGSDIAADVLTRAINDRGVLARIHTVEGASASYTAILQPDGDLVVAVNDMDVYRQFDADTLADEIKTLEEADWLIIDANLETSALEDLMRTPARLAALTVSTAKAPRLRGFTGKLDLLFTNRREALAMGGKDVGGSMDAVTETLRELDVKQAVISDGPSPVMVLDDGECTFIPVPSCPAISDVTGAGDALVAGTLQRLMTGENLCDAVRSGIAAAQAILQVEGPWRPDLADVVAASHIQT